MKKRFLTALLSLCLAICMFPAATFAAEVRAMAEGSAALADGANTEAAATVWYGGQSWRVIGYGGKGVAAPSGNMTLIAAGNLGQSAFNDYAAGNVYAGSTLQGAVEKIKDSLSDKERAAVTARTLAVGEYNGEKTDGVAGEPVENALLWPLSSAEAYSMNNALRITDLKNPNRLSNFWWLRSPRKDNRSPSCVDGGGNLDFNGLEISIETSAMLGVRPAFNLDLSSILFTSAADGGKPSDAAGAGALRKVPVAAPAASLKLTLKDAGRTFRAATTAYDPASKTVTAAYSGAAVGANEYISAIVRGSDGSIKYYGRIAQPAAADGTMTIDLSGKLDDGDALRVFSEQYNGDKKTDLASEPQTIGLTQNAYVITSALTNITSDNPSVYRLMDDKADYTATLSASGGYALPAAITVKVGSKGLTAGADYTYAATDGKLTIPANSISGDLAITAAGAVHAHSWSAAWTTDAAYHWHQCTGGPDICSITEDSRKDSYGAHTASGWITDADATAATDGSKHKECTVCGQEMERAAIPAAGSEGGYYYYSIKVSRDGNGTISPDGGTSGAVTAYGWQDKTFAFTPDKGYVLRDVLLDGVSVMDKVTSNTYTLERVNRNHTLKAVFAREYGGIARGVEKTAIRIRSSRQRKSIRLDWTKSKGYRVDYYQVYRWTKKDGHAAKAFYTTKSGTKGWYINTRSLKPGTRYYYKVRGIRIIDGKKIYTKWSNTAYRT